MKSSQPGANISDVEVTHIDAHGIWLFVRGGEHFLPYDDFPWFGQAKVADILDVQLLHDDHLHWPALDVDLTIEALDDPAGHPLVYR
jgi:hypothetical protein